jgi:alanine dehydrogenase
VDGIIHHCVPNMTAAVARTTSYGLTNSLLPYLLNLGESGISGLLEQRPYVASGINLYHGKLSSAEIAGALGKEKEVMLPNENGSQSATNGGAK